MNMCWLDYRNPVIYLFDFRDEASSHCSLQLQLTLFQDYKIIHEYSQQRMHKFTSSDDKTVSLNKQEGPKGPRSLT